MKPIMKILTRTNSGWGLKKTICRGKASVHRDRAGVCRGKACLAPTVTVNTVFVFVACFLLIVFTFNSCRSTKNLATNNRVLPLKTAPSFFSAYQDKAFQYNTLQTRIQFDITTSSGNGMGSRGQLKMVKNERIQLSIQPLLGIVAIMAEITPDSIKIVNRLNRWYMVESFDHIKGDMAIDFNFFNLQDLLTNRLFLPGETNLTDNQFNLYDWEQTATGYLLRTNDQNGLQYAFAADSHEKIVMTEMIDPSTGYMFDCNYQNFQSAGSQLFPANLLIRLQTANNEHHSLTLNFSRIEIDVPFSTNFPVPANYQRVSLMQIIDSIEQL